MSDHFYELYQKKQAGKNTVPSIGTVTLTRHDNASIYSYENIVPLSLEETSSHLEDTIQKVRDLIEASGGLIGHIKSYLEESCRYADFSSTGGAITIHQGDMKQVRISFTAIVFLMEENPIKKEIQAIFDAWI